MIRMIRRFIDWMLNRFCPDEANAFDLEPPEMPESYWGDR